MGQYYVYILASQRNGALYIGMTNDLIRRIWEHKHDLVEGFTKKYGVHRLVWYEPADKPLTAITREKQLKKWNRDWKLRLIAEMNPDWRDLYEDLARWLDTHLRGCDAAEGYSRAGRRCPSGYGNPARRDGWTPTCVGVTSPRAIPAQVEDALQGTGIQIAKTGHPPAWV